MIYLLSVFPLFYADFCMIFEVAGVADGMKAWELMKEKGYSFDLVLTEVAAPSLSGIELLTKITAAEECKNIPVISECSLFLLLVIRS